MPFCRSSNTITSVLEVLASTARCARVAAGGGVRIVLWIRHKRCFQFVFPLTVAEGGDVFGADSGDGLQHELGEIAEGDGVFAGDASLRHEEKGLGEGAVDAGCGGEVGAERFESGPLGQRLPGLFCVRRHRRRATQQRPGSGARRKT